MRVSVKATCHRSIHSSTNPKPDRTLTLTRSAGAGTAALRLCGQPVMEPIPVIMARCCSPPLKSAALPSQAAWSPVSSSPLSMPDRAHCKEPESESSSRAESPRDSGRLSQAESAAADALASLAVVEQPNFYFRAAAPAPLIWQPCSAATTRPDIASVSGWGGHHSHLLDQ